MRIYEIAEQYNDLIEALEEDPANESLQAMLDGLEGKLEDKMEAVLSVRASKIAEVGALEAEVNRLQARIEKVGKEADRLGKLAENTLIQLGKDKIKTVKFTAWMQNNRPSVRVTDESLLPGSYFLPQPARLDRQKLLDDVKDGVYVRPEVAYLLQTKSIRIR